MGGVSDEREVSLSTGRNIVSALDSRKYETIAIDPAEFGKAGFETSLGFNILPLEHLISPIPGFPVPDVVLIALHGRYGEDGTIQGLLELLGISYVGSGVLASALAMDKIMTRRVLEAAGVLMPRAIIGDFQHNIDWFERKIRDQLGFPVVVKPSKQGSTIGLSIVQKPSELPEAVQTALRYDNEIVVEEFIEGIEITGAVIGYRSLQVLPLVEIVPASGFYDYASKYTPGATEEIVPARIPDDLAHVAENVTLKCHKVLGCRDMSRTDMIVRDNQVYVLETNTIPGMTPTSLLPRAAEAAGIKFPELLDRLIGFALERRS